MNRDSAFDQWLRSIGARERGGELLAPCPLYGERDSAHRDGGDPYKVVVSRGDAKPVLIYCRCCGRQRYYDILAAWGVTDAEVQQAARTSLWGGGRSAALPAPQYDFDLLHRAYTELLRLCPLTDADRKWLRRRGVSDELAAYCGYGSIAADTQQRNAAWLATTQLLGLDYERVPGLCHRDDLRGPGVAIPCRGPDGRIRAVKVRLTDGGKSRWRLLSSRASGGLPAVNDLHFPLHPERRCVYSVWLTEGERKADVLRRWQQTEGGKECEDVVASPGVGSVEKAIELCKSVAWGTKQIVLAFDADAAGVAATRAAVESLRRSSWRGELLTAVWEGGYKGVDDAIAARQPLRFEPVELGPPSATVASSHTPQSGLTLVEALGSEPWIEAEFRRRYPQFNAELSRLIRSGEVQFIKVSGVGGCVGSVDLTKEEWHQWIASLSR